MSLPWRVLVLQNGLNLFLSLSLSLSLTFIKVGNVETEFYDSADLSGEDSGEISPIEGGEHGNMTTMRVGELFSTLQATSSSGTGTHPESIVDAAAAAAAAAGKGEEKLTSSPVRRQRHISSSSNGGGGTGGGSVVSGAPSVSGSHTSGGQWSEIQTNPLSNQDSARGH